MNSTCGYEEFQSPSSFTITNNVGQNFDACYGFLTDPTQFAVCTVDFMLNVGLNVTLVFPSQNCIGATAVMAVSCVNDDVVLLRTCHVEFDPFRFNYVITSSNANCLLS